MSLPRAGLSVALRLLLTAFKSLHLRPSRAIPYQCMDGRRAAGHSRACVYREPLDCSPIGEPFTLPHAFHIDSMWTPGTLCGVYVESTYTQHNFFITERRVDSM
jgi:hypothetical protein